MPKPTDLPTHLDTERLSLRPYRPGDGRWYYPMALRNQPHLARYESDNPVMTIDSEAAAERVIAAFAAAWDARDAFFLGAFHRVSGQFVAQIYIGVGDWELPRFRIGYFADVDQEGHGYVTEAVRAALHFQFHDLNAHRVSLECDTSNQRSIQVAERCGLVREGHLRQNRKWSDGTITGTYRYAILRDEFYPRD